VVAQDERGVVAEVALQPRLLVVADVKGSVSWVYKVAEAGLLPWLRIGSMLRFEPEVVRAFVRSTRAGSAKVR